MYISTRGSLVCLVFLLLSACSSSPPESQSSSIPASPNTPFPSPITSPTPTPSPLPTITPTATPSPTPIGGSGGLIIEPYEIIYKDSGPLIDRVVSHGIYAFGIATAYKKQLLPPEYHLEGIAPNGDQLLISRGYELFSYDLLSEESILLATNFSPPDERIPTEYSHNIRYSFFASTLWTPDTDLIYYLGYEDGRLQIFSVKPDGTARKRVTSHPRDIVSIYAYTNGKIYFEERSFSGPYYDYELDLISLKAYTTQLWPGFIKFSTDGGYLAKWGAAVKYEQDLDDGSIILTITDLEKDIVTSISPGDLYENGEDYDISTVADVWWSFDNDQFIVSIAHCSWVPNCREFDYFLLDPTGQLIQRLNLPVIITKYIYSNHEESKEGGPRTFTNSNIWSPDGKTIIFHNDVRLILCDLDLNSYLEQVFQITGEKYPVGLSDAKVLWIPGDISDLFSLPTLTPTPNPTYTPKPSITPSLEKHTTETSYPTAPPYSGLPQHIEIVSADYSITKDSLEITITLRDLPEKLPVNREGVCDSCWEYLWGAFVDNDNNRNTGGVPGLDVPVGWEYALLLVIDHGSGAQPEVQSISDHAFVEIWEVNNSGGWNLTISPQSKFQLDRSGNTITISGILSGISIDADLVFYAFDYNPDGMISSDYFIPAE